MLVPALLGLRRPERTRGCRMSETIDARWYVVQTQVNGEAKAARKSAPSGLRYLFAALSEAAPSRAKSGLHGEAAVPALHVRGHRHGDATLAFDTVDVWRDAARHATATIRQRCQTASCRALRAREDDKGFVELDLRPTFAPGDKVRVLTGAFMDNAGLFDGLADHDRVSILLDMLGRKVRVLLHADMVASPRRS